MLRALPPLLLAVCLLLLAEDCAHAAAEAFALWWSSVLPALFPFYLCTSLLLRSGAAQSLVRLLRPVSRLLCLPQGVLPCLLLTLLLAACQPTPAEDVVVNKGDGVYEQKLSEAQATAAPQNGQRTEPPAATPVPCLTEPHWKGEIAFRYLTIDIDVDVEAPLSLIHI